MKVWQVCRHSSKGWPENQYRRGFELWHDDGRQYGFRVSYGLYDNGGCRQLGVTAGKPDKELWCSNYRQRIHQDKVPEFIYRELDIVRVKGKDRPVSILEPICETGKEVQAIKDELKLYREALKLYRAQSWDLAKLQFINLRKLNPQRYLYQMYIERIAYFRQTPPGADWDGIFTFQTK